MSEAIDQYVAGQRERAMDELFEFLRIGSVSTDPAAKRDVTRCAAWVRDALASAGMKGATIYETAGHPIVYAESVGREGAPTLLLYGHYDVQPPDPLELWVTPPFEPEVRDDKIFARGATDDKGQLFCHIKGIEAVRAVMGDLPVNLKVLIEGEEEIGSVHLEGFVREHAAMLACDAVVISDSSMYAPGVPSITYGLRGLMYAEVSVRGPGHDLHSGLYGGAVPNPINELARIIATFHDDEGRIAVDGFYDAARPLESVEREAIARLPYSEEAFLKEVGAAATRGEEGYSTLERTWARPTLDCNGIWGGFTGAGAKTVIPSEAHAKISCRLVPDQDSEAIADLIEAHIERVAHRSVSVEFRRLHGGPPALVSIENPIVEAASAALERSWGRRPVFMRSGGSIPVVATFAEVLDTPSVLIGLGLSDDRLHSPNEKFDVENFYKGIETAAHFYAGFGS